MATTSAPLGAGVFLWLESGGLGGYRPRMECPVENKPKVLVLCQGGQVRSVGFKYHLTYILSEAECIPAGVEANSKDTLLYLGLWADTVVLMDRQLLPSVPEELVSKLMVCDVGVDNYHNPFHPTLQLRVKEWLEADGNLQTLARRSRVGG